jgi:hypothetical protein
LDSVTNSALAPNAAPSVATLTIEVIGFPQANAGPDVSICENTSHTLNGSALNYSTTVWTSEGDGTFDDPFILNATYTPGPADIENGSVQLKLYAMAISPCIFAEVDEMMIFIGSLPSQPPMPSGPTFITPDTTHSSEYYISTSTNSNLYQWELNPPEAGSISSMDTLAEVNWDEDFQGILSEWKLVYMIQKSVALAFLDEFILFVWILFASITACTFSN